MLYQPIFKRFCEKCPLPVMARVTMESLLAAEKLNELFDRVGQVQYTRAISFSSLVELMIPVTCGFQKSVHASYRASADAVGASPAAMYEKLAGVETTVSEALVEETAAKMAIVINAMNGSRAPLLAGYSAKILDGNCLGVTEHRIFELRSIAAGPLPGKSLAVLDPARRIISQVFACEDGHAQERSLLERVLGTVQANDLWIADRNFCTIGFLTGIARREACFIIRHHRGMALEPCGNWKQSGQSETGYVMERTVKIVDDDGQWFIMRLVRINLLSATRDGDDELLLLTNVPESDASGLRVAELYRDRWTIETAFQNLTTILRCEINTLGYPKAALFSFAVAVLSYNIVAVLLAAVRSVHGPKEGDEDISVYYIVDAIVGPYRGMEIALSEEWWEQFRDFCVPQLAAFLQKLAANIDPARFRKSRRGPKKPATPRIHTTKRPHVSTKRLLDARKAAAAAP